MAKKTIVRIRPKPKHPATVTAKIRRVLPIPGFPDYFVSESGKVYSEKSGFRRQLRTSANNVGFLAVRLHRTGRRPINNLVHHLVLLAFVGPRPPGQMARHRDGNPQNNQLSNLTYRRRSRENGAPPMIVRLTTLQVKEIKASLAENGSLAAQRALAEKYGKSLGVIAGIRYGKTWKNVK